MIRSEFSALTRDLFKLHNLTGVFVSCRFFSSKDEIFEDLILKNTFISTNHLTPELKLRLITPECNIWYCKETESPFPNDPFWGIYWPGGQALGRYILDNKKLFQHKSVVDIGSGSGACALAAAKSGAKFVMGNDIDPISITAIRINSQINCLKIHTCQCDLIEKNIDSIILKEVNQSLKIKWDVILIGDMFYDSQFSIKLFSWLIQLVKQNKLVLIGDPKRHALKELESMTNFGRMLKIAEYELPNKEYNGFPNTFVFKIVPS